MVEICRDVLAGKEFRPSPRNCAAKILGTKFGIDAFNLFNHVTEHHSYNVYYNIMEGYMNLLHMCFYYLVALCMPIAKHPFGFFGKTLGPLCQILRTHQSDCASQTQKT